MRVSLDLSRIFSDHRSLAYVLINKKSMKLIQDVEEKIQKIFSINNFYLSQQEHYLPTLEDISILFDDCVVCVVPLGENYLDSSVSKKKQKKKKQEKDSCKKRKVEENEENDIESDTKTKKKNKKHKSKVIIPEDLSSVNNEPCHPISAQKNVKKKEKSSKQNSIEEHISFLDRLKLITIPEEIITQRPPNIVKIVKVSNDVTTKPNSEQNVTDSEDSSEDEELIQTAAPPDENNLQIIPKRRRKRIRKRRKAVLVNNITSPIEDTPIAIEPPAVQKTASHIIFNDVQDTVVLNGINCESQTLTNEETDNTTRPTLDSTRETLDPPRLTLNTVVTNQPENGVSENTTNGNDLNLMENNLKPNMETEEITNVEEFDLNFIMKHSPIDNAKPKEEEMYAFRVLTMNEHYNPIFSGFIIGKVLNYDEVTNNVTFEIKQGLKELLLPTGKFSLEDTPEEANPQRTLALNDLLYPRLLQLE